MSCAPHLHTFKKTQSLVFFIQQIAREVLFWFLMFTIVVLFEIKAENQHVGCDFVLMNCFIRKQWRVRS